MYYVLFVLCTVVQMYSTFLKTEGINVDGSLAAVYVIRIDITQYTLLLLQLYSHRVHFSEPLEYKI